MSEIDPIEFALQKLGGAKVTDNHDYVLTERPYDLTTREGKINKAIEEERLRKRAASQTSDYLTQSKHWSHGV